MEKVKKRIKKILFRHLFVDKKMCENVKYLGSEYGGFYLDINIKDNPIVLDVGIGEDMSFSSCILNERPLSKIFALDPTEKSFEWFKKSSFYQNKNIVFIRKALAKRSGKFNFHTPKNEDHVSCSLEINKNVRLDEYCSVEALSLSDLRRMLNLTYIDVLKIDVEGSEYAILEDLSEKDVLPTQICVEYHDRFYNIFKPRSRKTHRHLKSIGYELVGISDSFQEITYKLK